MSSCRRHGPVRSGIEIAQLLVGPPQHPAAATNLVLVPGCAAHAARLPSRPGPWAGSYVLTSPGRTRERHLNGGAAADRLLRVENVVTLPNVGKGLQVDGVQSRKPLPDLDIDSDG